VPDEANSIDDIELIVTGWVGDAAWDIDIATSYAARGELANTHTDSDAGSTYNITAKQWKAIDLSDLFDNLAAGDFFGVEVENNDASVLYVLGVVLTIS